LTISGSEKLDPFDADRGFYSGGGDIIILGSINSFSSYLTYISL